MVTQYPPFAGWSDDDHSSAIIIVTALCLFYWLIPGVVQQGIFYSRGLRFTLGEATFIVSMGSGIVQSLLILVACHYGLGKSEHLLQPHDADLARRVYYVSNLFFILVLGLIKCSVALFVANLTVNNMGSLRDASRRQKAMLGSVLAATIAWTIASIIVLALPCGTETVCIGTMERWEGIFAGDAVTDIAIAFFAANIVLRTQVTFRLRLMWYLPFVLRACVPICAGLRLVTLSKDHLTHDPTRAPWLFVVLSQIQVFLSLIGYTSPALKKTMRDLVTNYGAADDSQAGFTRTGGSHEMDDLRHQKNNTGSSWQRSNVGKRFVPFTGGGFSEANAVAKRGDTGSDGDSQEGIIRRDEVEISYVSAKPQDRAGELWI
ncbi:hypothetical protein LTR42_001916 [Elasticomyces elasticus]|nr:hypothetical protein LTR42_001916 [Elasticomyces elasticus]